MWWETVIALHLLCIFRHAFQQHTWTLRVWTGSWPGGLCWITWIKGGTSSTEQAALAGGECYMTRLELSCDLLTKLHKGSKIKLGSCTQQQHDTQYFFSQSPDNELMIFQSWLQKQKLESNFTELKMCQISQELDRGLFLASLIWNPGDMLSFSDIELWMGKLWLNQITAKHR